MENLIIIGVIAAAVGAAVRYIRKAKKRGASCIGCPGGCKCNGKCGGSSNHENSSEAGCCCESE